MEWNTMKNIIIVIAGLLLAFFIFSTLENKNEDIPQTGSETQTSLELVSLKGVKIYLDNPKEGDAISSPLVLKGRAPGNWFFEASAPVVLTDWDGLIIAQGYITAEGDWMTTDYVPFSGTLNFTKPSFGERGSLILQKDNPSDERSLDDAVEISIKFK